MEITCPVCERRDGLELRDTTLNMYKCRHCDHAFSLIAPEKRTRYVEEYYNDSHANWFNNPNYWLFEYIRKEAARLVRKKEIKVLDIGCGKGHFLKYLSGRSPDMKLFGADLCDNEPDSRVKFIKTDFLKTDLNDKFDVVCSMAAIEHMDNVSVFLAKIKDILAPGGIVFINTENTGGAVYTAARILKCAGLKTPFYSLYEPAHLQHFTNRSLRALVEKSGLSVISQRNHNYPVKAVNLPPANVFMTAIYSAGIRVLFSAPGRFGILQTIVCKKDQGTV